MEFADRFLEAWNSHDPAKVAALLAPDGVYEDIALGQVHSGRDALAAFVRQTATMAPDVHFEEITRQQNADRYCIEWWFSGTNTGGDPAAGMPPTNRPFRFKGVSVGVLENGLIKRNTDYWNMVEFLGQQGLMGPPPNA